MPRIAFLKGILEDGTADGVDPIDKWNEPNVAGQAGKYYLIYFGEESPTNWVFQLYKDGLNDGMRFKVDIIDTWGMTITPVRGTFVTEKKDRYYFKDEHGQSVSLPGRTDMALRICRIQKGK